MTNKSSLNNFKDLKIPKFDDLVGEENIYTHENPRTLQLNIGNLCNLACKHCHVYASPKGENIITEDVKEAVLQALSQQSFKVLDITGGAPEMMPGFEDFILRAKDHSKVMVRTNLCILEEASYTHLPEFYKENGIHLVGSLPSTSEKITDKQRGRGVYDKSIRAIKKLNDLGYGKLDQLELDLVFNPNGAMLPPEQASLEARFKEDLYSKYGLVFNKLLTITNNPIGRFGDFLMKADLLDDYMDTLYNAFNRTTVDGIMCKDMISVSWDGKVYDCDFNQMVDLGLIGDVKTIFDVAEKGAPVRKIAVNYHCYGCTAGSGSSCGGSLD